MDFIYRQLNINDLHELILLKNSELSKINNGLFIAPSDDYQKKIIEYCGLTVGAFYSKKMIGFASIVYPSSKYNLGKHLVLSEEQLKHVAHLEHTLVKSSFRNKGVCKRMIQHLLNNINEDCEYVLCTISPYNINSLSSVFNFGFYIIKCVNMYNDVLRYVLCYDIKRKKRIYTKFQIESIYNINAIRDLISNSYEGYALNAEKTYIIWRQ